jgi:hypothetical protein
MIYRVTRSSFGEFKKLPQLPQRVDINQGRLLQLHRAAQSTVEHPLRNIQPRQLSLLR